MLRCWKGHELSKIAHMLNDRAKTLLKTLVEHYIADGQPVGSRALSKYSGLDLSPASVRNVMADLEESGLIASPHTSAGRIPTAKGYRFFVDTLLTIKPLDSIEIHHLEGQLQTDNTQKLVSSAAQLLSDLTHFAGIVVTPKRANPTLRHIEFLSLGDKRILLITVASDGDVQNRIILTDHAYTSSVLIEAANFLNANFSGCSFEQIRNRLRDDLHQLHQDISKLMSAAFEIGSNTTTNSNKDFVISGEHHLLGVQEFSSNMSNLRKLFDLFEQKTGLLRLLDIGSHAQGVQIYIGQESGLVPLDECSVVTSPYEVDGQVVGTVGVVGPTRMAYERVIPIVDITAKLISNVLSYH